MDTASTSAEGASGFTFFVMFLPYPSGAFVPIDTMPSWIQGFAEHQPVTPVIETIRSLLLGTPAGSSPWHALAWCGAILAGSAARSGVLSGGARGSARQVVAWTAAATTTTSATAVAAASARRAGCSRT